LKIEDSIQDLGRGLRLESHLLNILLDK